MKLCLIDKEGLYIGFFDDGINKDIPKDAIEIQEDIWRKHINGDLHFFNGKEHVVLPEQPEGPVTFKKGKWTKMLKKDRLELALAQRKASYNAESDPLFMQWQFDGTPEAEEEWRNKVQEIKDKYPLS